jgi:hypothetical protein
VSDETEPETELVEPAPAAYRRPGLVALLYGYRALAGLLLALPAAAAVGGVTSSYPRAQAELFDVGGVMLIESVRLARRAAPAVGAAGATVTMLATALGLIPLAVVIAGLGRRGRLGVGSLAARTSAHAGTLALLFGLGLLAQAVAAAIVVALGSKLLDGLKPVPPTEDLAFVAVFTIALGVAALIGVVRDLAYVAAVHRERGFYMACVDALRGLGRAPARALGGYAWRASLGLAALALAAWAAPSLTNASRGAIAAGILLHQAALLGAAFARVSWLAAAIRIVTPPTPEPPGT